MQGRKRPFLIFPDAFFQLRVDGGGGLRACLEIDMGTESKGVVGVPENQSPVAETHLLEQPIQMQNGLHGLPFLSEDYDSPIAA